MLMSISEKRFSGIGGSVMGVRRLAVVVEAFLGIAPVLAASSELLQAAAFLADFELTFLTKVAASCLQSET